MNVTDAWIQRETTPDHPGDNKLHYRGSRPQYEMPVSDFESINHSGVQMTHS